MTTRDYSINSNRIDNLFQFIYKAIRQWTLVRWEYDAEANKIHSGWRQENWKTAGLASLTNITFDGEWDSFKGKAIITRCTIEVKEKTNKILIIDSNCRTVEEQFGEGWTATTVPLRTRDTNMDTWNSIKAKFNELFKERVSGNSQFMGLLMDDFVREIIEYEE